MTLRSTLTFAWLAVTDAGATALAIHAAARAARTLDTPGRCRTGWPSAVTGKVRPRIGEPGAPLARPQDEGHSRVPYAKDENAASGAIWPARRGRRCRSGHELRDSCFLSRR